MDSFLLSSGPLPGGDGIFQGIVEDALLFVFLGEPPLKDHACLAHHRPGSGVFGKVVTVMACTCIFWKAKAKDASSASVA